jgi:hypothetical protein
MHLSLRAFVFLMVLVSILTVPAGPADAQTRPPECNERCSRSFDTLACSLSSGIGSGKNCRITYEYVIHAVDADGAGPGAPIILVSTIYRCEIDHCYWV